MIDTTNGRREDQLDRSGSHIIAVAADKMTSDSLKLINSTRSLAPLALQIWSIFEEYVQLNTFMRYPMVDETRLHGTPYICQLYYINLELYL